MTGQVAQSVEQRTENPRVGGSNPSLTTIQFFSGESMIKSIITVLLLTLGLQAQAQINNGQLSGFVGINNSEYDEGNWDRDFGVELGASYVMPLANSLSLRSGAGLVQKNSELGSTSVKYLYLEIPLTLMFQANAELAFFGGFNFDMKLNSSPSSVTNEEFIVVNLPLGARYNLQGPHSIEGILEFGITDMATPPAGDYKLANSLSFRYLYTF